MSQAGQLFEGNPQQEANQLLGYAASLELQARRKRKAAGNPRDLTLEMKALEAGAESLRREAHWILRQHGGYSKTKRKD